VAAGAILRRVRLPAWRHAVLPYLVTLQAASAGPEARSTTELLAESGEPSPSWRSLLRGGRRHTATTRLALAADKLPDDDSPRRSRLLSSGRTIAEELREAIGDGVLLHPAHPRPAPRHGQTVGRPWLMVPAAMFNLAGVPVTEVPLGLNSDGLPVGVQVAAGQGCDHVAIAVALELERVFGGWVPPAGR
jgi:fatty acid amide hydrolase 2